SASRKVYRPGLVPLYLAFMRKLRIVILVALGLAGCQKPLFPTNTPRTQYETYDRMRNRYMPLEEPDVFGNPQPALRARLSQPR
ncbi:MAG: hypothetical protein L0219_06990, partial [Phycisphaerales bacterium]|nr:hypothetical protein [Phycisphaerales bacterium]